LDDAPSEVNYSGWALMDSHLRGNNDRESFGSPAPSPQSLAPTAP
jgi:hypothetical protein